MQIISLHSFHRFFFCGLCLFAGYGLLAQQSTIDSAANAQRPQQTAKGLTATGFIKDASTKKNLAAINVSVPGYSAALTDDNGKFSIQVPDYNATLFIQGEGFQSKEVALKGQHTVTTALHEESFASIYDNVVLPFGVKPRNQATGAVASIHTEGSWNRSTETPGSYLQGKVAGLSPIMRSGTPNVGAFLMLRGYNSLYGSNQPLMVVDGMIYDNTDYGTSLISGHYTNPLADIDIKDIENITVIKDAAASTYGTKGANGVILITTTHAKELATKIDAAVYGGVNFSPKLLPVMDPAAYRTYLSDLLSSSGLTADQVQAQPYMNDNRSNNPDYFRYHNNTNWQKRVFNNSSPKNVYLKVTGGDNIAKYALSLGYLSNGGVIRSTDLTKYNVRFNGDLNLSKKLTATTNLSYTYYEQNLSDQGLSLRTNPLYLALTKAPFLNRNDVSDAGVVSPNLAETDIFGISNPAAALTIRDNSKVYRFFGSLNLRYQFNQYLSLYSQGGITVDEVREQKFVPRKGIAEDTLNNAVADSRLAGQARRVFAIYNESYADYTRTFGRIHRLQARAGLRFISSKAEQDYATGANSPTDNFISVGTGVALQRRTGGDIGKYVWANTYAGVDYSLADKYFFSGNVAVDGSSRFGTQASPALNIGGTRYAVMPSLGASWLVSSEKFMSGAKILDVLKLRVTYGRTGNDDIGNYTSRQLYVSQNLLGVQGLVRGNIGNPALMWEVNDKANIGADVALLNERLSFTVDVFRNKASHIITYEPVPIASGFEYAITNNGSMKTSGIEAGLNGRIISSESVAWDLGFVISTFKNRITQLPGNSTITSFGGATVLTMPGMSGGLFYGYKTNGVYATDAEAAAAGLSKRQGEGSYALYKGGDVKFIDLNGDKIINDQDRQVIGNPNPDYTGGIRNRISWGGLSLEALFTFSKGNDVYNGIRAALESGSSPRNQLVSVINRWRAPGQVTNIPKATYGDPMGNSSFSDRWIEDGSFLRLKVLSLAYAFQPRRVSFIKSSSLYITGYNLLTFTHYLGFDPEFQAAENIQARGIDIGLEPQFRSVVAGIRFGL